jgi:hypothetical protein
MESNLYNVDFPIMPYFIIPVAFNDFVNGENLQNEFALIAVKQDHSGQSFLFSRETYENLHLEPHFAFIPRLVALQHKRRGLHTERGIGNRY